MRCMVSIGLWLELGSGFNVKVRARLMFMFMVRCGYHRSSQLEVRFKGDG